MGGLLRSLFEVLHECDARGFAAQDVHDPENRVARQAVSEYLRMLVMMSRAKVVGAVEFLVEQESCLPKEKVIGRHEPDRLKGPPPPGLRPFLRSRNDSLTSQSGAKTGPATDES